MTSRQEVVRKIAKIFLEKTPKERQELTKTSQLLGIIYDLYKSEKEFKGFILNPTIPKDIKLNFLKTLREKFQINKEIDDVLDYILDINAVPLVGEIKRIYDHEVEKLLKVSKALLVLARKVKEPELEKIKTAIKKFTGRDYEFEVVEDPELIGGFLVKTSSLVLDASVRRGLETLLRS
ncbi:MAG: ATP synthase F1 subunit delta [Aquificaceae bacterium]|nr:ATP synthase F1 subunit delta [Aquificaceae bacterium]